MFEGNYCKAAHNLSRENVDGLHLTDPENSVEAVDEKRCASTSLNLYNLVGTIRDVEMSCCSVDPRLEYNTTATSDETYLDTVTPGNKYALPVLALEVVV